MVTRIKERKKERRKEYMNEKNKKQRNKPDRATMRPDCVPTWSEIRADCVRQMDEQTEQIDKLLEYLT